MARRRQFRFLTPLGIGAAALALTFTGIAPATATASPTKTQSKVTDYVNLGDSYSAGFGSGILTQNPMMPPGCFQGSGPTHVTALDARPKVNLTANAACAGFTTAQIAGAVPLLTPYLAGAELVTLTLGANDLDIRGLVTACSTLGSDTACDGALRMGNLAVPTIGASAHQTLRTLDAATRGKILVLGYPRLFTTSNGDQQLITAERAKQLNRLGDALNLAIKNATKRTSAKFVSVTGAFNNHGLGANKPWIYFNQVDLADPFNLHPTTDGYLKGYYPAVKRHL
ncbi:GDSL-type esterase/lipase family protein [Paeniglutamicibacter sulfureus]|uniref:GDSL-type esterase/lipase family protein n=1 Tax=Paeniglutamicibacter sulfureus TaxID=43666 RepID=UPI0026661515|nr:GDSL-type esterase/lipase family protein [Paeniglutamicibacter sulfureus]MDO2935565.1 GDSL-type esterase/lipase family protein [Paeniglutamicibacter sulfureus]